MPEELNIYETYIEKNLEDDGTWTRTSYQDLKEEGWHFWYRNVESNIEQRIFWKDGLDGVGEHIFSFDRIREFNLFSDYPYSLTAEEKNIFDDENPHWKDFFHDRGEEYDPDCVVPTQKEREQEGLSPHIQTTTDYFHYRKNKKL